MKKLTLLLSILITLSFQAQQIPNGDFENWITQEWGEEPENWGEYFMQGFHEISPGLIDNTIVKSDDAYSGSYAMEIRSFTNTIFGETDTIVPMVILNLNNANSDSAFMLLDSGLISLSGYFKQDLADEDDNYTAIYVTAFYEGQQSGYGIIEFEEDIEDYTAFDIPIQYITSTLSDSIILMIFGGNQDNQLPGNTLLLDGLQFNYDSPVSTNIEEDYSNSIKLFPNPSNNNFKISSNELISLVEITDLSGRVIYNSEINQNSLVIDTREFTNTIFIVRCIINGNNVINKLVVTH
jgi:hypothetical protein